MRQASMFAKVILLVCLGLGGGMGSAAEEPLHASAASPGTPPYEELSVEGLARRIAAHFPKVTATVTSVQRDRLVLDQGSLAGLKPGYRLDLYREGKAFVHPLTKEPLGRHEQTLGTAEIERVEETQAVALLREGRAGLSVVAGDRARMTAGRIRAALVPADLEEQTRVMDDLYRALGETGRFALHDLDDLTRLLRARRMARVREDDPEQLRAVGQLLGVSTLFLCSSPEGRKGKILDVRILSLPDLRTHDRILARVALARKEISTPDLLPPMLGAKLAIYQFTLPYVARLVASGDLDGDGREELVISNGSRLFIYRVVEGRLEELWKEPARWAPREDLALYVADPAKRGQAQIFLSSREYGQPRSAILAYREGRVEVLAEKIPYFLRVLALPGEGPTLLIQGSPGRKSSAPVQRARWTGDPTHRFEPGDPLLPQPRAGLYGFVLLDTDGDGVPETLELDGAAHLVLSRKDGGVLWRSPESYGGEDREPVTDPTTIRTEATQPGGRLLYLPQDGAGEVILRRNEGISYFQIFESFKGYRSASLYSLAWSGTSLVERWRIEGIEGFVHDFQVGEFLRKDRQHVAVLTKPTLVSTAQAMDLTKAGEYLLGKSTLLIYALPEGL
ncbi:MAG: hypothetical protein HZA23_06515 [Nitrospirae bacterium]|nr:hypothetical protein [Nitrospirota bacterium]